MNNHNRTPHTTPEIQTIQRLDLAFISHKGKMEAIGSIYNRLVKWATQKD